MVISYCVVGCHNADDGSKNGLSFYRIPAQSVDSDRRNRWIAAISRKNWEPSVYTRLCSEHFVCGCKSKDPLSPDYVPSVFPYTPSPVKRRCHEQHKSYLRRTESKKKRRREACRQSAALPLVSLQTAGSSQQDDEISDVAIEPNATVSCSSCDTCEEITCKKMKTNCQSYCKKLTKLTKEYEQLHAECQDLRTQNIELKQTVHSLSLTDFENFKDNNEKVNLFTGLQSFQVLMTLFNFLKGKIKQGATSSLSESQQFLLTLMRLRLNLSTQLLGYMFGVHQSTASRIFLNVIDVMHKKLIPTLLFWPDKEVIYSTMPISFKMTFPKCISIIDCFEIFCERPSDLKARAQIYSSYKSHNTVKYLISITPQGFISFLSNGWGGRTSDKHVGENSGYLDQLLQGDVILADRGFSMEDSIALHGAKLHIPAFTKGKPQLRAKETEDTRNIASVRIHVERVTGLLRQKFSFLESLTPISIIMRRSGHLSSLDKIVAVCAALSNTCTSVVPFN